MLKKLVSKILALALCASTLAALPQPAYAAEGPEEPTPVVIVEPEEPTPPVGPEEPGGEPQCTNELPEDDPSIVIR